MLLPFSIDGSPNPSAVFCNALLTSALYHQESEPFDIYASIAGGQRQAFASDPSNFEPDYGVITAGGEALVILGGTTNAAQWIQHCASQFFPAADRAIPLTIIGIPFCVGSFLQGQKIVEPALEAAISSIGQGTVRIAGHSYGAAAGHIYGRHLANASTRPRRIELMTFGEPMAYDGRPAVSEPDYHARLIACPEGPDGTSPYGPQDPVTLMPTGSLEIFQFASYVKFLKPLLAIAWTQYGSPWRINSTDLVAGQDIPLAVQLVPYSGAQLIIFNLPYAALHFMDQSYLPKALAAWQRSGLNPELSDFLPYAAKYTGQPFAPLSVTGPAVSADTLNEAYFPPGETPITDSNRPSWEVISSVGGFFPAPAGGVSDMPTLMRGSFLCGTNAQGFSETFHSNNPNDTYQSMQTKLATIMPKRVALSNGINDPPPKEPNNQLTIVAFRISDDLKNRDVLAVPVVTPVGWNGSSGNANANQAVKIVWRDVDFSQIAVSYLHCVPNGGIAAPLGNDSRTSPMTSNWTTALAQYCAALSGAALGFNTINNSPANAVGAITGVTYSTVTGYYSITTANTVPQGKFRVALRGFRSLRVLNGRQAAVSTGLNTFQVLKRAAQGTWDNTGTAVPLSGYNNFVPFSNYIVKVPSSASATIIIEKKLGRPFFLQAGRITRRAA